MADRMSAAEFAARCHLIGLSGEALAETLGVNPRTVRAWMSGRDLIPHGVTNQMDALMKEHADLMRGMVKSGTVVLLPRDGEARWPRSWYVAAAARAVAIEPDMMLGWRD